MKRYEYIIVGAGSAGAALAAQLLEARGAGRHPLITIPLGYGKVFHDARFN